MDEDGLRDAVYAKTGYIRGVSVLSGYVRARSGTVLAFSVLMNDLACSPSRAKAIQNDVCRILAAHKLP